ncbi:MAG TPA: hypothetical protein EYQ74_04780 [Planctomycetes bacterium]|nr:hypothetical protein [Planctomycetota bacterium]HIK61495.1 hypothetical protein [Planctomycetota bacterium]
MSLPPSTLLLADPISLGVEVLYLIGAVIGALLVIIWMLWRMISALGEQAEQLDALQGLEEIAESLESIAERSDELGRRRLEHVLIDIRDGHKRFEERWLAQMEKHGGVSGAMPGIDPQATSLSERITNRLLAMGFERIDVLSPVEEVEAMADGDGEVRVEARRGGVAHKGHVLLREGSIADVRLRDGYDAFP